MIKQIENINAFIGRNEAQNIFRQFLFQDKALLNIYSENQGGIGKTWLLLRYIDICKVDLSDRLIFQKELIDLYDTDYRTATGIMESIANAFQLDTADDFTNFFSILIDYQKEDKSYEKKSLFQKMERHFFDDFDDFSKRYIHKTIVIFMDSYEYICDHEETLLSRWIEKTFIPKLPQNVKLIIAGRKPLTTFDNKKVINLTPFNNDEIIEYWMNAFNVSNSDQLEKKLDLTKDQLKMFSQLTQGKPILVALFVDLFNKNDPDFSPEMVISYLSQAHIDKPKKQRFFEQAMVSRFSKTDSPVNSIIGNMAFINRRMTKDILYFLFQHSDIIKYQNYSKKNCEDFLTGLKQFSFVKYKKDNVFLLHDEMQRLINDYYWEADEKDPDLKLRKEIAGVLVKYYDQALAQTALNDNYHVIYHAERFYYQIFADLSSAFLEFHKGFQKLLDNYQIYHIQLLLQEITQEKYYKRLKTIDQLKVDIDKMRWLNVQYMCQLVLDHYNVINNDPGKFALLCEQPDLRLDALSAAGEAYLWLNQFDNADNHFKNAALAARQLNDPFKESWMRNWIGYTHMRHGAYEKAESIFQKAIHRMILEGIKQGKANLDKQNFIVRLANMYGNMNLKRYLGGYYEASIYGQIAISILKKQTDQREYARNLTSLGESLKFSNKMYHAYQHFTLAKDMTHDPLIQARIHTYIALLYCRHLDYIYIMEDFSLPINREKVMALFKKQIDLEKAASSLANAHHLLKDSPHQLENYTLLFYQGLIYSINDQWEAAIQCFTNCENICTEISYTTGQADACVEKMRCLYFAGKLTLNQCREFEKKLNSLGKNFYNVQAKKAHILGNVHYDGYRQTKNADIFKKAIYYYVMACDHMYQFGKIRKGRYYNALRTLVHRLCMLSVNELPDSDALESVRDIWEWEDDAFVSIDNFSLILNDLLDFVIFRKSRPSHQEIEKKYNLMDQKVNDDVRFGGEAQRLSPMYAQLLLRLAKDLQSNEYILNAYYLLGYAHYINNTMFLADYFYQKGIMLQKKVDPNSLLYIRLLIRQTAPLFRREVFIKILEFSRKDNIKDELQNFKEFLGKDLNIVSQTLQKAQHLLEGNKTQLKQDNSDLYDQTLALLYFRLAEHHMVSTFENKHIIEEYYLKAIEISCINGKDIARCMKSIEGLFTFYYLSDQYDHKIDEIQGLMHQLEECNKQNKMHQVMAHAEITNGDYYFDQIEQELTRPELIQKAFQHYFCAMELYNNHSSMELYECARLVIQRIGELPQQSAAIFHNEVYTALGQFKAVGKDSDKIFALIQQCLTIHGELL
jgi:hypothetical protein